MHESDVAAIRASKDYYRASDVARHYSVSPRTVQRVWEGATYPDVRPAREVPCIPAKPRLDDEGIRRDIRILKGRGMSISEVAEYLGVSQSALYRMEKECVFID